MPEPAESLMDAMDGAEPGKPSAANDAGAVCPVTPVGYLDRKYHILNRRGDVMAFTGRELSRLETYGELFGLDMEWLYDTFKNDDGGLKVSRAQRWFIDRCRARGYYDESRVRGVGAYPQRRGILLHCGDGVRLGADDWAAPGEIGAHIYVGSLPIPRPADDAPATAAEAGEVFGLLGSWNWAAPEIAPRLLLGAVGCAYICGALDWRPHTLVTGFPSTGKTWLVKYLKDLVGHGYYAESSEATPAFVRDTLGRSTRPVFLDEFEQEVGTHVYAQMLVRLARLASSRFQAGVGRSSTERKTTVTRIDACFFFTGVNPPALDTADAGRITVLDLLHFPDNDPDAARAILASIETLGHLGPALFARMIQNHPVFEINLACYRTELMRQGYDSRATDQYSHLLAAADTLLRNQPVESEEAAGHVQRLDQAGLKPDPDEDNEASLCLGHLLTTALRSDERTLNGRTVGEIVMHLRQGTMDVSKPAAVTLLLRHGLNVIEDGTLDYLVVANRHQALTEIYAPTKWAAGAWRNILGKHTGALKKRTPARFLGVRSRANWIPVDACIAPDVDPPARARDTGLPDPGSE